MAVCVFPGTELAFTTKVTCQPRRFFGWKAGTINHTTAIFRQINKDNPHTHHDALEFPDGQIVLLTSLDEGQEEQFFSSQYNPLPQLRCRHRSRSH